jgi:hypothetical protein
MRRLPRAAAALLLALSVPVTACGDDDGADVRDITPAGEDSGSGTEPSGSGTEPSGSGTEPAGG